MAEFYTQERLFTFFDNASLYVKEDTPSDAKFSNTGVLRTVGQFSFPSNIIGCSLSIKGYNLEIDNKEAVFILLFGFGIKDESIMGNSITFTVQSNFLNDSSIQLGSRLNKSTWVEVSAVAQCE